MEGTQKENGISEREIFAIAAVSATVSAKTGEIKKGRKEKRRNIVHWSERNITQKHKRTRTLHAMVG